MLQVKASSLFWARASMSSAPEGVKALEAAGACACDDRILENRTRGLPKHVKEKVEAEMTKRPKETP